jgi:hypothetical protein
MIYDKIQYEKICQDTRRYARIREDMPGYEKI